SKMYQAGVVCSDCHEPHSGKLRASGNALCARCHNAATYDTERHRLHRPNQPGSECVQRHMPTRRYMGVDDRRDHRFGLPRPDLSLEIGVPNACTTACHQERRASNQWAKTAIERAFGSGRPKTFARALYAAQSVRAGGAALLVEVAADRSFAGIVRATAL